MMHHDPEVNWFSYFFSSSNFLLIAIKLSLEKVVAVFFFLRVNQQLVNNQLTFSNELFANELVNEQALDQESLTCTDITNEYLKKAKFKYLTRVGITWTDTISQTSGWMQQGIPALGKRPTGTPREQCCRRQISISSITAQMHTKQPHVMFQEQKRKAQQLCKHIRINSMITR